MNLQSHRHPVPRSHPKLPLAARWTLRGLVTLPLIGLTVSASVYCASVYRLLHAHLVPIAESELTRQLGHEVRIGGADFSKRGALVLTDIAVSNKATFAAGNGEATVAAKRLTVDYNLHSLIFDSGNAAHALGDITVESPTLLVERYPGRFNFSDFFKPKTNKVSKPFVGRVLVHNGLLRFRDFDAPDRGKRPALNTLAAIDATIDFFSTRNVYFDVRGLGLPSENRFHSLIVNGDVSRLFAGRYRGHVIATNADAAYWTDYFKAFPQARIASGRADADVTLSKLGSKPPPGLPLDLSGHLAIRNAKILVTDKKLLRMPLENLNGTAAFTSAGVSLDARVTIDSQPLAMTGTIFDFAHPQVAVTAKSSRLDPIRLARAVPVIALPKRISVAPGPVTASFTGTPASPTITVSAFLPAVVYLGNQATNVAAQATYASKVLSVTSVTFRLNGTGQAALRGTVDTTGAKPVFLLAGRVQGVNLAKLRLPATLSSNHLNFGGLADTQFLADNQGRPLTVVANISAANLRVRETTLQSVTGRVAWTLGHALTLTRAVLRDSRGTATVSGTVPAGGKGDNWNLNVRTTGLDIGGLLKPYSHMALNGRVVFDGKVIGPAVTPQVAGAVRLIEPRYGRYSANLITGLVTASTAGVRLRDVTVRRFPTEATLNGTVTELSAQNPALALHVKLSEGDVADFLRLAESASAPSPKTARALTAGLPNLTGTAEGVFDIGGHLQSPIVSGHALVTDATVGDYRIDQAAADVRYAHDILHIENGLIRSGAATLTASGERSSSGILRASFAASGLDLLQFHPLLDPYADVTGTASLAGHFYGTPQAPQVAVSHLEIPDLVINRQKFAPFTLAGRFADGILTQTGAPWRFLVSIPTDYAAEAGGQVEYDIDALRLTLPSNMHPQRPASLALSAAIPVTAPERLSHIFSTVRSSLFGKTPAGIKLLTQLANLPQPISGTFALPHLTVEGPLKALTARGELSANNLALGETKIKGLTAQINYTSGTDPSGSVTAEAKNLFAAGELIGAASADIDYRNRIISVHKLQATSDRAFFSASGTANLDGDLAASLDASNVPIKSLANILPSVVPYFQSADPDIKRRRQSLLNAAIGALPREVSVLQVNAAGPTASPNLTASVSLANPEEAAPPEAIPVEKKPKGKSKEKPALLAVEPAPNYALDRIRSGTITLASATPGGPKILTVSDLSAFKNGRLVATLSGSLPLIGADNQEAAAQLPDEDLHAVLKVQDLAALAGFSPGALDPKKTGGQLSVTANFGSGQLSGLATLTDASVGMPTFDTSVNKINGIVVLGDNKATIQSFSGQSSKGGSFQMSGQASLSDPQGLDLRVVAKDLTVDENSKQNVLYEKFSSVLKAKINGAMTIAGPFMKPHIATPTDTPIVVSDAVGTLPTPTGSAAEPSGPPDFNPSFDIVLLLGGGKTKTISVRSGLLKADAVGGVRLLGTLAAPRFRADLTVARGQFILPPSTVLKIIKSSENGANTVSVNYPVNDVNGMPGVQTNVNITAQTTISPSQTTLAQYRSVAGNTVGEAAPQGDLAYSNNPLVGGRQRYTITVYIHGLLGTDGLQIDPSSSPVGLTKAQIYAALVPAGALVAAAGGGAGGQSILEDQFKTALANVAIPSLLTPITESVASALGLSDLNVTYDPSLPLFVSVTKQLTPKIDATFSRSFGGRGATDQTLLPPQYTLKLGYDLTNRYRIGVSTDEQHNNTVTFEGVIRF